MMVLAVATMDKLRKKDWTVRPIDQQTCKRIITTYHYAKALSQISTERFGLFRMGQDFWEHSAHGCSVWLPPTPGILKRYQGFKLSECLALTRLAIAPEVPTNGASFLIGQSIQQIRLRRPNVRLLVTYADTMQGHTGAIYRATNWHYDGMTTPQPRWMDKDGKLVSVLSKNPRPRSWMDARYKRTTAKPMHRFYMEIR